MEAPRLDGNTVTPSLLVQVMETAPLGMSAGVCTLGDSKTDCPPGSDFYADDLVVSG